MGGGRGYSCHTSLRLVGGKGRTSPGNRSVETDLPRKIVPRGGVIEHRRSGQMRPNINNDKIGRGTKKSNTQPEHTARGFFCCRKRGNGAIKDSVTLDKSILKQPGDLVGGTRRQPNMEGSKQGIGHVKTKNRGIHFLMEGGKAS